MVEWEGEVVRMRNEKGIPYSHTHKSHVTPLRENMVHCTSRNKSEKPSWMFRHSDPFNCSPGSCPSLLATL